MITHHIDEENHILEVTISGSIEREELAKVFSALEGPLKEWDEIRVLKRVDSFTGMELKAWIDDFKFAFNNWSHYRKIKKVALVTEKEWVSKAAELMKVLIPGEVRVFENDEIEKARNWLK